MLPQHLPIEPGQDSSKRVLVGIAVVRGAFALYVVGKHIHVVWFFDVSHVFGKSCVDAVHYMNTQTSVPTA